MGKSNVDAASAAFGAESRIQQLLRYKFPQSWAPPPLSASAATHDEWRRREAERKAYQDELRKKSSAEIDELHRQMLSEQEKKAQAKAALERSQRFYLRPEAKADFETWGKIPVWSLDEGIALSVGLNPKICTRAAMQPYEQDPRGAEYFRRRLIAERAMLTNPPELSQSNYATHYVRWMQRMEFDPPAELVAAVSKRGEIQDWKDIANKALDRLKHFDRLGGDVAESVAKKDAELAVLRARAEQLEATLAELTAQLSTPGRGGAEASAEGNKGAKAREVANRLRLIGALLEAIDGTMGRQHPDFPNDAALIRHIVAKYPDVPGLKERTLQEIFPEARAAVKAS